MKKNRKITISSMLSMFKQKLYCLFTLFYHYTCCSSDYYSKLLACFNVLQVKAQPTSDTSDAPCKVPYISWWPSVLQVSSRSTLQAIGIGCGKESGAPRLPLGTFIVSACFNDLFRVASHFFSASSFPLLACKSRPWRH